MAVTFLEHYGTMAGSLPVQISREEKEDDSFGQNFHQRLSSNSGAQSEKHIFDFVGGAADGKMGLAVVQWQSK